MLSKTTWPIVMELLLKDSEYYRKFKNVKYNARQSREYLIFF